MVEAHTARDNVGDWKLYYLWFPRRFDGVWHWRKYIFRRRVWNGYDDWYEYSFSRWKDQKYTAVNFG
jgi:hypothetical protein